MLGRLSLLARELPERGEMEQFLKGDLFEKGPLLLRLLFVREAEPLMPTRLRFFRL